MVCEVLIKKEAEAFLKTLNKEQQIRIWDKLGMLSERPHLGKPLVGRLAGFWELRVDNYRAIYMVKDIELVVLVLKIGHRRDVFKQTIRY